jgi:hypothetical protein
VGLLHDHFQRARDNRRFAEQLVADSGTDSCATTWAVTVVFYAAVHCIEGHLARQSEHSRNHDDRRLRMLDSRFGVPERVFNAYRRLEDWSRSGRYEQETLSADFVRERAIPSLALITTFVHLDS